MNSHTWFMYPQPKLLLFFPMNLILFLSIPKIMKEFNSDDNFLLLAWILPNLFFLELIPTKLEDAVEMIWVCLLYTSPSPRDVEESRMPSSA